MSARAVGHAKTGPRHGAGVPSRMRGVTVIELMITVAIAGIVLALALPSFSTAIRNTRLTSQANQLVYSLNLARSAAVKRAAPVSVCQSANATGCQTTGLWEGGWIVFADTDADATVDTGEDLLQVNQALRTGFSLRVSTAVPDALTFNAQGTSNVAGTFALCAQNRIDYARAVGVNLAGRVRPGGDSDLDGIPQALDGTEITSCTSP